jgi:hypothetical protein
MVSQRQAPLRVIPYRSITSWMKIVLVIAGAVTALLALMLRVVWQDVDDGYPSWGPPKISP